MSGTSTQASLSLRRFLITRLSVLILGTSLLAGSVFAIWGLRPIAEESAEAQFGLAANQVMAQLDITFRPIEKLLGMSESWLENRPPDLNDPTAFNHIYQPVLSQYNQATSVVAGTTQGQGWLLLNKGNGEWRNRMTDVSHWGNRHLIIEHHANGEKSREWIEKDYDPRLRPWFTSLVNGRIQWTKPYAFLTTGDPGVTASRRFRLKSGHDLVVGVDLKLRDLSQVTLGAEVGAHGVALVTTQDGLVVALPSTTKQESLDNKSSPILKPVSALGNPAIEMAMEASRYSISGIQSFKHDGELWLAYAQPYSLGFEQLRVLVLAPLSDFMPAWSPILIALLLGIIALLIVAAMLTIPQARKLTRPLEELAEQSMRISQLDFAPHRLPDTQIEEVHLLAVSLDRMRNTLQENQQQLSDQTHAQQTQIAALKAAEARYQLLAYYDPLTGLANRACLQDRLRKALQAQANGGPTVSLLFMDLDRFKEINDTLGHSLGDVVLRAVAGRLRTPLPPNSLLARMGGDEFVILAEGLSEPEVESLAMKLVHTLDQPIGIEQHRFNLGISIGLVFSPADGDTQDDLLRNADIAMYCAKQEGGGVLRYQLGMSEAILDHVELARALKNALKSADSGLHLVYQPQFDLRTHQLIGAEALLRWRQPDGTMIPPSQFIPIAEERAMMSEVGEWVLIQASKQLQSWVLAGLDLPGVMAINVSVQQMEQSDFPERALAILKTAGIAPERIELELTESGLMRKVEHAIEITERLRKAGFQLAIDDFGTGYSSLTYLKRLPAQKLKIDQSFVRDMLEDKNDRAIVSTIVAMGKTLDMNIIAEGVETLDQAQKLEEMGCEAAQGYLFGRPVPPSEFASLWLTPKQP